MAAACVVACLQTAGSVPFRALQGCPPNTHRLLCPAQELGPQDLPPEVWNATLAAFDERYLYGVEPGSEAWVPCSEPERLAAVAGCVQVGAAAAALWHDSHTSRLASHWRLHECAGCGAAGGNAACAPTRRCVPPTPSKPRPELRAAPAVAPAVWALLRRRGCRNK